MYFMRSTIWSAWKRIVRKIGDIQARIILSIFYFTIVVPFGILVRFMVDPLRITCRPTSNWVSVDQGEQTLEMAEKQS